MEAARQPRMTAEIRLYLAVGASVLLTYGLSLPFEAPDLPNAYYVWLEHIRTRGTVQAFSVPFGDYTPPYLYLLAASSAIGASPIITVKIVSIASCLFMALGVRSLLLAVDSDKALEAGLITLILPTVLINGPLLGQCDGLWVGCCLFAVAESARGRLTKMAIWAGVGFAIKAQAVFIAPFCAAMLWRDRNWWPAAIPPLAYLALMLPAALAGWPLPNLLRIYGGQYDLLDWLSTAPNLWAGLAAYDQWPPNIIFIIAYVLTATATVFYIRRPGNSIVAAALLSAMYVPWLMPKMHERYFLLADILALCLAYSHRKSWPMMVAVQLGSLMSLLAYIMNKPLLNVAGSIFMTAALLLLLRQQFQGWPEARVPQRSPGPAATTEPSR